MTDRAATAAAAARAAVSEGEEILKRAFAELRPWRPPDLYAPSQQQRPAQVVITEDHGDIRLALQAKVKIITAYAEAGRWVAAAIGLIELRDLHHAAEACLSAQERSWRYFLSLHLPMGANQAERLMARMRRGSVWTCSHCGAATRAPCGCAAGHRVAAGDDDTPVSAFDRARAAIAEHPDKSNRLIAKQIGVGEATVRRARRHDASGGAPRQRRRRA